MIVFVILAAVVVVAIGLVAVGRVTAELAAAPRVSVFDLDEAVQFVADRLSPEPAGQLSYDDVRQILDLQMQDLEDRGVASEDDPVRGVADPDAQSVVTDEESSLAYVLGRLDDLGADHEDRWVAEVIDLGLEYLAAIGAIGSEADEPGL